MSTAFDTTHRFDKSHKLDISRGQQRPPKSRPNWRSWAGPEYDLARATFPIASSRKCTDEEEEKKEMEAFTGIGKASEGEEAWKLLQGPRMALPMQCLGDTMSEYCGVYTSPTSSLLLPGLYPAQLQQPSQDSLLRSTSSVSDFSLPRQWNGRLEVRAAPARARLERAVGAERSLVSRVAGMEAEIKMYAKKVQDLTDELGRITAMLACERRWKLEW